MLGVSPWWAADRILNVVIVVCHVSDRTGIARLPGTRGSDPSKISLAFHQGNDRNLLHSPKSFMVKGLRENLPTVNLSRGLCILVWTITFIYFFLTYSMVSRRVGCKVYIYQTICSNITLFNKQSYWGLSSPCWVPKWRSTWQSWL